jgi:dienelactone hydrolase
MKRTIVAATLMAFASTAGAQLKTEVVDYTDGDTVLEGYLAYDVSFEGKRPGVIVVHEWWGLTQHPKERAKQLAELGYVAFALDMYGKDRVTDAPKQAAQWSGQFRTDPALAQRRFQAGWDALISRPQVDAKRVAAIGFCFGGTICLEMARLGLDLDGVVSFHGGLASSVPEDKKNIRASILVCHGADDPHVPLSEVEAFVKEMRAAKADWQLNMYGGAVHSFTNPEADKHGMEGVAYNEEAARRSWAAMQLFFDEIFEKE